MPDNAVLCYIRSRSHGPTHVYSLVGSVISGSSRASGWLTLLFFLWGCKPLQLLQSFPYLFHWCPRTQSDSCCEYLHLSTSGAGIASQGTAIPGSCQQVFLGISNSVWVWCLQIGWIPRLDSLWMAFPPLSASLFFPAFPFERNNSRLPFLRWVGDLIHQPRAVPIPWIWSLQVLFPLC